MIHIAVGFKDKDARGTTPDVLYVGPNRADAVEAQDQAGKYSLTFSGVLDVHRRRVNTKPKPAPTPEVTPEAKPEVKSTKKAAKKA